MKPYWTLPRWALVVLACASDDDTGGSNGALTPSQGQYAPCNGEPGSCGLAVVMGGSAEGCRCKYYCETDSDCPVPSSGTAAPTCEPFGDYSENGHTAACILTCVDGEACPDGMFCHTGECWGAVTE